MCSNSRGFCQLLISSHFFHFCNTDNLSLDGSSISYYRNHGSWNIWLELFFFLPEAKCSFFHGGMYAFSVIFHSVGDRTHGVFYLTCFDIFVRTKGIKINSVVSISRNSTRLIKFKLSCNALAVKHFSSFFFLFFF